MSEPDYVQYHNVDQRERWPIVNNKKLAIYWTGNRRVPKNARVWLIAGETVAGRKKYWLRYWFVVDEFRTDEDANVALGVGQVLEPPVEITSEPWFREFLKFMGNFGRGVSPLRPSDVLAFEKSVENAGLVTRPVKHRASALGEATLPEELPEAATFWEGAGTRVMVNSFERDRKARAQCIQIHGARCVACGIDFARAYGARFTGLIVVHHKKPLSEIRASYRVDPAKDLVPICANCHLVVHQQNPPIPIEELIEILRTSDGKSSGRG